MLFFEAYQAAEDPLAVWPPIDIITQKNHHVAWPQTCGEPAQRWIEHVELAMDITDGKYHLCAGLPSPFVLEPRK
ncbi:hypothetical protein CCAX7_45940 [Capsulimonas corticalis]|uniref:Uncharacterized protein n=1 Tax=Capsulimonas corticalis TaxID=2219043 RepID=A0A402D5C0_9BACT|nr:hypothetical protein CCAX7_45940 [Capsulimonas corticalis]